MNQAAPPPPLPTARCTACHQRIDPYDRFCRYCGKRQAHNQAATWYYHPIIILLLAFLVLGPFAIPLIWRSPQMKRNSKILWTVIITLYTIVLLYLTWKIAYMTVQESLGVERSLGI